jgi:quercetin dioxygenase-like cupin family protein
MTTEKQLAERRGIHALQDLMFEIPEEERIDVDEMTSHHFAPGVYAREYFIPAGSVVIGKIHKTEHFNIICKGKCSVSTEDGPMYVEGPQVIVSRPGVKKAVYAFEDTTWITIHVTEETDLEKIEEEVIAKDYAELEHLKRDSLCHGE